MTTARKNFRWRVFVGILILGATAGTWKVSSEVHALNLRLKCEYTTAAVLRNLQDYVDTHQGSWPTSWKDLGDGKDHSAFTRFRFDLSSEDILRQPGIIYEAVTPVTGRYRTYPYAKQNLEGILKTIQEKNGQTKGPDPIRL